MFVSRGFRRQVRFKRWPVLVAAAFLMTAVTSLAWTVTHLFRDDDDDGFVAQLPLVGLGFRGTFDGRPNVSLTNSSASSHSGAEKETPGKNVVVFDNNASGNSSADVGNAQPIPVQNVFDNASAHRFTSSNKNWTLPGPWPDRPYFFKDGGTFREPPSRTRKLHLYPEEDESDRIVEQLMFNPAPSTESDDDGPNSSFKVKHIVVTSGFEWVASGNDAFLSPIPCPVTACSVSRPSEMPTNGADAVLHMNSVPNRGPDVSPDQVWILYILESPHHSSGTAGRGAVNWTATYRTDSDLVAPYEKWVYYDPNVRATKQPKSYAAGKTKQVAWFVSNCGAKNNRLEYAKELGKHIGVDIYGRCGDKTCNRGDAECSRMLDQDYKFYLAFENSNCEDYITEKFFANALMHEVLPIVMGARADDYRQVAPEHSFLHVDDFDSPKALAEFLHALDKDDAAYDSYFQWKGTGEFIDTRFWCRVCALLHDPMRKPKHYEDVEKWWRDGKCV